MIISKKRQNTVEMIEERIGEDQIERMECGLNRKICCEKDEGKVFTYELQGIKNTKGRWTELASIEHNRKKWALKWGNKGEVYMVEVFYWGWKRKNKGFKFRYIFIWFWMDRISKWANQYYERIQIGMYGFSFQLSLHDQGLNINKDNYEGLKI